jgi:hypothetical protein
VEGGWSGSIDTKYGPCALMSSAALLRELGRDERKKLFYNDDEQQQQKKITTMEKTKKKMQTLRISL